MTKKALHTVVRAEVAKVLEGAKASRKVSEAVLAIIDSYLQPKTSEVMPPKVIDGKTYYYCRFHQKYEAEEAMVLSNGKSKGYCKASIAIWNRINRRIKAINSELIAALRIKQDNVLATKLADEQAKLQEMLNNPTTYNYERDWNIFNKKQEFSLKELLQNKATK